MMKCVGRGDELRVCVCARGLVTCLVQSAGVLDVLQRREEFLVIGLVACLDCNLGDEGKGYSYNIVRVRNSQGERPKTHTFSPKQ